MRLLMGDTDELAAVDEWLLGRTRGEMAELALIAAFTIESLVWMLVSLVPLGPPWRM